MNLRRLFGIMLVAALPPALPAQLPPPTARDTVFAKKFKDEANRRNGPRKSVVNALADSLVRPNPLPPPTPAAPKAGFTATCDSTGTFLCQFDGTASTGYKLMYVWDCGVVPNCTPGSTAAFSFKYPNVGQYTARVTVRDSLGRQSDSSRVLLIKAPAPPKPDSQPVQDSLAFALPRSVPAPVFGKATRVLALNATTSDLQAVLNAAQPGDSITLTGDFPRVVIPAKACGMGISITGTDPALPAGTRQTPSAKTGRIITNTSEPAVRFASPTCQWRLDGIEIVATTPTTTINYGIVAVGDGNGPGSGGTQTALDKVPQQIILSHMYIHGTATTNSTRCVSLQSGNTVIRDSYISDCHAKGFDSQAICGWNGPGPYLIENNYLEGAGENIMFGGAAPYIYGLIPSDITIRRNHFIKFRAWQGVWTVKNLFELKAANRVLIEQNVFQNIWPSGQEGFSVVIKSNQGDETNPVSLPYGTSNVTIQGNVIDTASVAVDIHWRDCYPTCPSVTTNHVLVRGNYARNVGLPTEGRAAQMMITGSPTDIMVTGNSFYHHPSVTNTRGSAITFDGKGDAQRLTFTNNYFDGGAYGVIASGGKIGSAAFDSIAGPGNWTFSGNAVTYAPASRYPAGNIFPPASTVTSGVGANIQSVLNGVNGVVQPQPLSLRRRSASRQRPRAPTITAQDSIRLRQDPSSPWKPSAQER